jgi:multiple sugar transport system permease protein
MATGEVAGVIPRYEAGRRRRWTRILSREVLPRVVLIAGSLLFLAPFYWMVVSALKTNAELTSTPPSLLPGVWAWDNFVKAVNYIPFGLYAFNSFVITLGATIGAVLSNTVVAYGFSRINWRGRNTLFYICVGTIFLPYPVVLVALVDTFGKLHWVDTFLPLIVPAFFGNPFYIFLMRQFMLGIPRELSDAARVDGAGELQVFWKVILPLTRPAVTVVMLFAAVAAWNDFLGPLLYLHNQNSYTLAIGLQFFRSTHDVSYNLLMAASTLVVLPVVVVFLFAQRFFIQGITVGGVKG